MPQELAQETRAAWRAGGRSDRAGDPTDVDGRAIRLTLTPSPRNSADDDRDADTGDPTDVDAKSATTTREIRLTLTPSPRNSADDDRRAPPALSVRELTAPSGDTSPAVLGHLSQRSSRTTPRHLVGSVPKRLGVGGEIRLGGRSREIRLTLTPSPRNPVDGGRRTPPASRRGSSLHRPGTPLRPSADTSLPENP